MIAATRIVRPELLDDLTPDEPRAQRSRRDLQRVHFAMRSLSILRRAIARLRLAAQPQRILELGAGDGTLLLRLARSLQPCWPGVALTLLDRHDLLSAKTRDGYSRLGWDVTVLRVDALNWAADGDARHFDLSISSLFLHHFDSAALKVLLPAIAACSDAFLACEPGRHAIARLGSRVVGILGANAVTRADAVTSVAAGFAEHELTAFWPRSAGDWNLDEYAALPFTHCFAAVRAGARRGNPA